VRKHVVTSSPSYSRRISAVQVPRKLHVEELRNLTAILHHLGCHYGSKLKDNGMGRLHKPNGGDDTANAKFKHKKGKITRFASV